MPAITPSDALWDCTAAATQMAVRAHVCVYVGVRQVCAVVKPKGDNPAGSVLDMERIACHMLLGVCCFPCVCSLPSCECPNTEHYGTKHC
jgi:hypothetical protein